MAIEYTQEQKNTINALGSNIIVSASAGAGKTAVLIARLMKRIIQDEVKVNQICAMTFTDAAAQEMKSRLLKEMHKEYQNNKTPFLEEQISLVETAEITTIHSYCLNLIKNYGYIIGISPSRTENILDEAQVKLLQEEAFTLVLNEWLENKYTETYELVEYFSVNPLNLNSFKENVKNAGIWIRSKSNPEQIILEIKQAYSAKSFDEWPKLYQEFFFNKYKENLEQILFHLNQVIDVVEIEAKETTVAYKNNAILRAKSDHINQLLKKIRQKDISFYDEILQALDFKLPAVRSSENFKEAREPLLSLIESCINNYSSLEEHFNLMNDLEDLLINFVNFTIDYLEQYQDLKEIDNSFDFDDFEHFALELLRINDFAIAKKLQNHYQEIMVDEFQDTNDVQDEIIRLISNGKNLFRVGDIKQSIYRFRGANPKIMKNLMLDTEQHTTLALSSNFRSKEPIVEFNNHAFKNLMDLTSNKYSEKDIVNCGSSRQFENPESIEFHLFTRDKDNDYDLNPNEQRALHIAQEIIRQHEQGRDFKDMTVLIRSHAQKAFLKQVFEDANIPHYISERIGFFNSDIVAAVLNLLRYSISYNEYYLANGLLSPFYNLSEDDLAIIKMSGEHGFRKNLKLYDPNLYEDIHNMTQNWRYKDIVSILEEIYSLNDAYNSVLSLQDKTNLDFLLDKAIQFQESSMPSVQGFLIFVDALEDDQSSEASHLSEEDDLVQVMTIHQSKGLQFPLVFYWGTGSLTVQDHMKPVVFDEQLGIAFNHLEAPYRLRKKTLIREIVEYKQVQEEAEEMLRLLYVALTRPESKLIIVDVAESFDIKPLNSHLLLNYKRQVDLLLAATPSHLYELKIEDAASISNHQLDEDTTIELKPKFNDINITIPNQSNKGPLDGLELNPQSKWAMEYGTVLHEAIENLPHDLWAIDLLSSYNKSIQDRLVRYNQHAFTQELYTFDSIEHELPFLIKDKEETLNGIIDFVAFNQKEIIIVDFKSDKTDKEGLIERYEQQILGYKKALELIYPEHTISSYIYSFNLNEYILLDFK